MNHLIVFVAQYAVFLLPLLILVILRGLPEAKRLSFFVTLAIGSVLSLAGILIASHLFYDPRPFVSGHAIPLFSHAADNGFPSDHMTLGATLAFIGYAYSRKIGLIMILVALLVGVARVAAHVHSWVDIVGGTIIGLLAAVVAFYSSRYISDRWLNRPYVAKNKIRRTHA